MEDTEGFLESILSDDDKKSMDYMNEIEESLRSADKIISKVFSDRKDLLYSGNQAISSPELNEIKVELMSALVLCKEVKYLLLKLPF